MIRISLDDVGSKHGPFVCDRELQNRCSLMAEVAEPKMVDAQERDNSSFAKN